MSKININLNGAAYEFDESVLASASADIKSHLSSVMNGEGATINFDGTNYSIDSTKLSAATNDFIAHLGTIVGEGAKVVIGGVEYSIDSNKVSGALSNLESAFDALSTPEVVYSEGLEFTSNGNGTCEVSGIGTCTDTDIVIPSVSPEGDKVTRIASCSFENSNITSLVIPEGVQGIGNMAVSNCRSLTSVTFPSSLTYIDNMAFEYCTSLKSVVFPSSLYSIGEWAFNGCTSLTEIIFLDTTEEFTYLNNDSASSWHDGVPATAVMCTDGKYSFLIS